MTTSRSDIQTIVPSYNRTSQGLGNSLSKYCLVIAFENEEI